MQWTYVNEEEQETLMHVGCDDGRHKEEQEDFPANCLKNCQCMLVVIDEDTEQGDFQANVSRITADACWW